MKYTILIALLLAASCTHHQPCNDTNQACAPGAGGITGVIVADAATPHSDVISGCRSPHFDAEETEARADQAFSDLQYDDAFGGYLAVCDQAHLDACERAIEILDRRLLTHPPEGQIYHQLRDSISRSADTAVAKPTCRTIPS